MCREWQYVNLGATCGIDRNAMTIIGCTGSVCDFASGDLGKCIPYVANGASCTELASCAYGLACIGGTCAPEPPWTCP
jgi:hypothetical protein